MYLPRQQDPWRAMLPQMAGSLFQNMLSQKMYQQRFGIQQEAARKAVGETREYQRGVTREAREYKAEFEPRLRTFTIDDKEVQMLETQRGVFKQYAPKKGFGPMITAKEGDVTGLPVGTVYQKGPKEQIKTVWTPPTPKIEKQPAFNALLGKLQSLRKKRADQEARITQMGYEYELTPSVKKAREMMDASIRRTENLMKKRYPDLWKDYQGEETRGLPIGLPDPKANKGRITKDTITGKRYESDGITWSEI